MEKTSPFVILLLVLVFVLSGCSGAATAANTATVQGAAANAPALSLNEKLAAGTLKLEGTDLAVTVDQAKTLLPLWKAVKSLSASDTASQLEIDALYQQIQDALTDEQLAAIEKLDLSGQNMQSLMTDLGIEMPQGAAGNGLSDSERATRIAELRASGNIPQGGGPGGEAPGGGMQPGGAMPPGGGDMGGDMGGGNFVPPDGAGGNLQTTPQPGQANGRNAMRFGAIFIDPLIKLLETRAAG